MLLFSIYVVVACLVFLAVPDWGFVEALLWPVAVVLVIALVSAGVVLGLMDVTTYLVKRHMDKYEP